MEKEAVSCSACGVEINPELDQVMYMDETIFCSWCWSNDCCRASRDAAEASREKKREEPGR